MGLATSTQTVYSEESGKKEVVDLKTPRPHPDGKLYFAYSDIHKYVGKVAQQVRDFRPDVMLAIGGGGFIPARILRTFVNVPILAVSIKLYNDDTNRPEELQVRQWISDKQAEEKVKGKRVLIVDEVDDTRTTLRMVIERHQ